MHPRSLLSFVLLAAPLHASTWIVDAANGPGTQFLDLPPAIAGAAPGDILLVRPGSYSGFTLDKRLTLSGTGTCSAGSVLLQNTGGFARIAIGGIHLGSITIQSCAAPVVIQDFGSPSVISVFSSADVRLARGLVKQIAPGATGFVCDASVVELVDVIIRGGAGTTALPAPFDVGGLGSHVRNGGVARYFKSCSFGGPGTTTCGSQASAGGHGAQVEAGSMVQCFASTFAIFQGGAGGTDSCGTDCSHSQVAGTGLVTLGVAQEFGMTIDGPDSTLGAACSPTPGTDTSGAGTLSTVTEQPVWTMSGQPAPGFQVTFTLTGPPGADASYEYARALIQLPTGVALVPLMVRIAQPVALGTIPASGVLTHTLVLSPLMVNGGFLATQARVVMPGTNELRLSNSFPIVLR